MLARASTRLARVVSGFRAPAAMPLRRALAVGPSPDGEPLEESGIADPRTVSVIGAPMAYGQLVNGVDRAPQLLREHGLRKTVTSLGWRYEERGDVEIPKPSRSDPRSEVGGRNAYAVCKANGNIATATEAAARDGHFVLTLGGDHSIAIGSIAGLLRVRPDAGVIWVDAHADINTLESSPSGNIHGMPVSFLAGLTEITKIPGCEWLVDNPKLNLKNLVYIGLRDMDEHEKRIIPKLGIKSFTMQDVDRLGIGRVMEQTLEHLCGAKNRPLHLSFDIDASDPSVAPSTGTAVAGGLNYRESHYVCEAIAETGLLSSMDMVEVNPILAASEADREKTVHAALELIGSALGRSIRR